MSKFVVAKEADGTVQITFTIPYTEIKKAQDETIEEFAKDMDVPGFRKGKAPISKVKERITKENLIEHSLSHVLPKLLGEAITQNKLRLAIYPKFELVNAKEGEDWQIRGVTCELPEVNMGDYKSVVAGELRAAALKKDQTQEEKEATAIKALIDTTKLNIPPLLIKEEADSRLSNLLSRLEKLGLALESYLASSGKKIEDLKAEYAAQAKDAISLDLILNKIAELENLKVPESEIDQAVKVSGGKGTEENKRLLEAILKRRMALDMLTKLS